MTDTPVRRMYRDAAANAPHGVVAGEQVADVPEAGTVLFVIGMRVNRWRRIRSWWPVFVGMPKMLRELEKDPDLGLLDAGTFWAGRTFLVIQHWRSAEQLGRYAGDMQHAHGPAWAAYNTSKAPGRGDVGIFHETYVVPADNIETRYGNMPAFGLAAAVGAVPRPRGQRGAAHEQMGITEPDWGTEKAAG